MWGESVPSNLSKYVRRVEGYLENMLFAEGTYVNKNQVLFVINQDQYRAKADKGTGATEKGRSTGIES